MKTLLWLIRREIWENKALWVLPLLVGTLLILAALFGDADLGPAASLAAPDQPRVGAALWLFGFGVVLFLVMSLYSLWYLLDCLYVERKDRSVLFWRALPVSDAQTVLSKLLMGVLVIPFLAFLAADMVTVCMALAVTLRGSDTPAAMLWKPSHWLELQVLWLYLIATMALWYLPVAAWCLAVSARARQAVILWGALPILIPYLMERWFLHTHAIGALITDRFAGFVSHAFHNDANEAFSLATVIDQGGVMLPARTVWEMIDARGFFLNPGMWAGVALGVGLVMAAIALRRRHVEA